MTSNEKKVRGKKGETTQVDGIWQSMFVSFFNIVEAGLDNSLITLSASNWIH